MKPCIAAVPLTGKQKELYALNQSILHERRLDSLPEISIFVESLPTVLENYIARSDITSVSLALQIISNTIPFMNYERECFKFSIVLNAVVRCLAFEELRPLVMFIINQVHSDVYLRELLVKTLGQMYGVPTSMLNEQVRIILSKFKLLDAVERSHEKKSDNPPTQCSTRFRAYNFLPSSIFEQWILASDPNEISSLLGEVRMICQSLADEKRLDCITVVDAQKLVQQTMMSLKLDHLNVVEQGMKLLETLVGSHASIFVPNLPMLFSQLQRYLDDARVSARHHAVRFACALVTTLPFHTTGRYLISFIELKPRHAESILKVAALSLLCVPFVHPRPAIVDSLISRLMVVAGEYIYDKYNEDTLPSRAARISSPIVDAASDLIAIGLRLTNTQDDPGISCYMTRMRGVIGFSPPESVSADIVRRCFEHKYMSLSRDATIDKYLATASQICSQGCAIHEDSINILRSDGDIESELPSSQNSGATDYPKLPRVDTALHDESYEPSWACDGIGEKCVPDSPWQVRSYTPTGQLDRTKLISIKKSGRKPGSRRARTADESAVYKDSPAMEWELASQRLRSPAADAQPIMFHSNVSDNEDNEWSSSSIKKQGPHFSPVPAPKQVVLGPQTPIEVGLYRENGERIHRFEARKHRANRRSKVEDCSHLLKCDDNDVSKSVDTSRYSYLGTDQDKKTFNEDYADSEECEFIQPKNASQKEYLSSGRKDDINSLGDASDVCTATDLPKIAAKKTFTMTSINIGSELKEFKSLDKPYKSKRTIAGRSNRIKSEDMPNSPVVLKADDLLPIIDDVHRKPLASSDGLDYINTSELSPSLNPSKDINLVVAGLEKDDWPEIFHTLNTVRTLVIHHNSIVVASGQLHAIVIGTIKQVENLRSVVAKNAIMALGDIFLGVGKHVDSEVAAMTAILVKRCADSSSFISESADDALMIMIHNVTATRAIAALLLSIDNKNPAIRGKVARTISNLLQHRFEDLRSARELDALLPKLPKLLSDNTPEARSHGREIIRMIIHQGLYSRAQLEGYIPTDILDKVEKAENMKTVALLGVSPRRVRPPPGTRVTPAKSIAPGSESPLSMRRVQLCVDGGKNDLCVAGTSPRGTVGIAAITQLDGDARRIPDTSNLTLLPGIFLALGSKSWQERKDALDNITDIIVHQSKSLSDAEKLETCIDRVLERLEDGSIKVVIHAIQCLKSIQYGVPSILSKMLLTILPPILNVASSLNKPVAAGGMELLDLLLKSNSGSIMAQQLVNIASHGGTRVRSIAFRAMGDLVESLMTESKVCLSHSNTTGNIETIFKRSLFPVLCHTVCSPSTKQDIRAAAIDTLKVMQRRIVEDITCWTENIVEQDELRRMMGITNRY